MTITLTVNGEQQEFPPNLTVSGLLQALDIPQGKVAVERNLEIVPKSAFEEMLLDNGDAIEIVHFIGGG